jgi:hypothetical protein
MKMSSSKAFVPSLANRNPRLSGLWSSEDLGRLRALADSGASLRQIATALRRTESAVRNKACMHGISVQKSPRLALAAPQETELFQAFSTG